MTTRILGIDPGSRLCGWGVVDCNGVDITHVDNGVMVLDPKQPLGARLGVLLDAVEAVLSRHRPTVVAVEEASECEADDVVGCPENAEVDADGDCACKHGFNWNADGSECEADDVVGCPENAEIDADRPVEVSFLDRGEAVLDRDLIRTKVNLIPDYVTEIRVVDIVGLDKQADGGTHVSSTGQVGRLEVVKTESKGKGFKRVRFVLHDE